MKDKTFVGTFTAIMLASVPIWACGLLCTSTVANWTFIDANTAFGSIFWIPASMLTFVVLWAVQDKCRCKPALLLGATGIVPYSILATLFMLGTILPVLEDLFLGRAGLMVAAFGSLLLLLHSVYVACAYLIAGGEHTV
ncbi:MAG: hypothetical protein ACOC9J_00320 [Persicimonas sp.]